MYVAHDLGNVRVVYEGSPFDVAYDIRVECLINGEWTFYQGYNSLSNDYATSASREAAERAVKKMAAENA